MVRGERYEQMDDKYADYARYQYRKPQNAPVNRYFGERRSIQDRQHSAKRNNIKIYANGDGNKKIVFVFNLKMYCQKDDVSKNMDLLLNHISDRLKIQADRLYRWPCCTLITKPGDIDDDPDKKIYVCCTRRNPLNKEIAYGGIRYGESGGTRSAFTEKYSRNSHDSRGGVGSQKHSPTAMRSNASMNGGLKSYPLKVYSNKTGNMITLFKDPTSRESFEDILATIQEMFDSEEPHPQITTLYSKNKPQKKINSISSLNGALRLNEDTFVACTRHEEPDPRMLPLRDTSPMRNDHKQRQKNGYKQNGYQDDRMRQSNGYAMHQESHVDSRGREYQRHQAVDDEFEDENEQMEYEQESYNPPQQRRGQQQQEPSPTRDKRQPPYRQKYSRDEDHESPQRDNRKPDNRRSQKHEKDNEEDEEDRHRMGNRRDNQLKHQKRQQTPPRKRENRRRDDRNHDSKNDNDNEDDREEDNGVSDEEMQRRIDEMEDIHPDKLDKDVHY